MRYTPENITSLKPNEVFVYGSNQFGIHGSGSAKAALKFGAEYRDTPLGLRGQSYGIITKSFNEIPVTLDFISLQVKTLYQFAFYRPDLIFLVTKIGTALAGFTMEEIAEIFFNLESERPHNVILPREFHLNPQS